MPDPTSDPGGFMDTLKLAGTTVGGGGLVGAFMLWLRGKESQAAREEFLELRADVKQLLKDVGEHKNVFADVVELKLMVKALHGRVDEMENHPTLKRRR